ncbi:hypothetical protein PZN02_003581 [Sinorhizobium garamanticum]|uniref:Uncharacterized protein n=1 Tax=Sinorhizobium garamanticum TaxID=680247 RepID=A0ABY8DBZ0_9HYPH|nr:hypothetical protein [Sinorhizobium garamanticum]WEX87212.1 hypothetical protein PZN02_003581 [Sinorhizobium garamanticum]
MSSDLEKSPLKRLTSELQPVAAPASKIAAHRRIVDFPALGDTNLRMTPTHSERNSLWND